jgi:tetratricopeptide (TPR) repeat protein
MEDINKEYEKLLFQNPEAIDQVVRICNVNSFIDQFSSDPGFLAHKASVLFMKAEALLKLKRYQEALDLYKIISEGNTPSIDIISIKRISEILIILNKEPEAKAILENAIREQSSSALKLDLLYCYVNQLGDSTNAAAQFQDDIHKIGHELGIIIPENLTEIHAVVYLYREKNAAGRRLGELTLRLQ